MSSTVRQQVRSVLSARGVSLGAAGRLMGVTPQAAHSLLVKHAALRSVPDRLVVLIVALGCDLVVIES